MSSEPSSLKFATRVLARVVLLLALPLAVSAYETDQFNKRLEPLGDSTELLDARVNASIQDIVDNWEGPRDDWKFVNAIYKDIGGRHWVDRIERWAMKSAEIERVELGDEKSIYQGHPIWATRVAGIFGVGPTIKLNEQMIGSDKLGHFLSQGRKFYRRYQRGLDETEAAEQSAYTERAIFGQMTTGSYSNADLVANYEGYRFYRSLFEDGITQDKSAILSWEDDGWVIQRPFTWADHVNEYWDEALNVNHYDRLLYKRMKTRLLTFCPDYFAEPEAWEILDEDPLKQRYNHLQLRDTAELRLDSLCLEEQAEEITEVAGQ